MYEIELSSCRIGDKRPCFIIAEIGANHNGNIENAYKLIDIAKNSGANAVKFQSYRAETLYSKYTPRRVKADGSKGPDPYELIKSIQTPYEWHASLKQYCDSKGITFISSPFDSLAIDSLEEVGIEIYKVASSEIGDPLLIKKIASTKKPMIISTGKSSLRDIENVLSWCREEGNEQLVLLECVASYPCSYESMNLRTIKTLRDSFGVLTGFSDHNIENITDVVAVSMGACVIEKHVTLDREMEGPDHHFALDPEGLKQLVSWVRKTEACLGDGVKRVDSSEFQGRRLGNRSIHAKKDLKEGDVITLDSIILKRPNLGINPIDLDAIIGMRLTKDVKADMWITWQDFKS